jgi:tRNA-2-methylthio-N6-dimethylallyladenosine synthase
MPELHTKPHNEALQGTSFQPFIADTNTYTKYFYIESYGCAMNFNDSEIVASILYEQGYGATKNMDVADLILINTCSIRDKAEQTVRNRLQHFKGLKRAKSNLLVGVLGCMAERLKAKLLEEEKLVDMVIGPDAYRDLPKLIAEAGTSHKAINVLLSREETYADINPVRLDEGKVSSFVSIMRGCNNMCTFCVVPFTRGRERSREPFSIVAECTNLFESGYREVTLLGQNVDSYYFVLEDGTEITFAKLMEMVAQINPSLRVRFSTSHPKDITDEVLFIIKKYDNICNQIHLPAQSGNTRILQLMNRTYTREWYLKKVERIRQIIPDCGLSTDIITGFCSETDAEHADTISMIEQVKYDHAFLYAYSERPGTLAERRYADDVPEAIKQKRLAEIIVAHRKNADYNNKKDIGKIFTLLVEGASKKSEADWCGRTDTNKLVVFKHTNEKKCDYIKVRITDANSATLFGTVILENNN